MRVGAEHSPPEGGPPKGAATGRAPEIFSADRGVRQAGIVVFCGARVVSLSLIGADSLRACRSAPVSDSDRRERGDPTAERGRGRSLRSKDQFLAALPEQGENFY